MTDVLNVTVRDQIGTGAVRRLRRAGQVPAILYGHGEANVNLTVPTPEIDSALRHGTKLVDLKGGVNEKALIRAVQWDAFGAHVLHLDLTRVSEGERVEVAVAADLRGEAPGVKLGGILDQHVFELEIECPASEIPDKIHINIKALEIGESILASDLDLPKHITLLTPGDTVLVSCQTQGPSEEEEEEAAAGTGEPEVIGRKAEDSEEGAD